MMPQFRWEGLSEEPDTLFPRGRRVVGKGEYRGLTFHEVEARTIINEVPAASQMPFRWTINAYRGCSHRCSYCMSGETPILMADGRTKRLAEIGPGDMVYGTVIDGLYRRYTPTPVLDHWSSVKDAYRITLDDGTELIASGDHRFLSDRGWKYVTGAMAGPLQRPYLTVRNKLVGSGKFAEGPKHSLDYERGYLSGLHRFRLALVDPEALERAKRYLINIGVATRQFEFQPASEARKQVAAIRTSSRAHLETIGATVAWPDLSTLEWTKGFLAGIFDAVGSCSPGGALRISNADDELIQRLASSLSLLGFRFVVEPPRPNGVRAIRLLGGLPEKLRFFHTVDSAIIRKRTITGLAVKGNAPLGVSSIEPLGIAIPMYDITTGTGDFVANGVISHNCFARPTHDYLGFNVGTDFDTQIVVKTNAIELLRAETSPGKWAGESISMGTNTDPYQPAEGKYRLTRGIIEVLAERKNPFSILTKSSLSLRDLDLLQEAAKEAEVSVNFSIGTLDEEVWRKTEPGTPHPRKRMEAVARFNQSGVSSGVLMAPLLPKLSDSPQQVQAVMDACRDAGATFATPITLHLRPGVKEHFMQWLADEYPDLVGSYENLYRGRSYLQTSRRRRSTRPAPAKPNQPTQQTLPI
jgi:DNA repair photolyase